MQIRFTKHADDKFAVLARHGMRISKSLVIGILEKPGILDFVSKYPMVIAQGQLDKYRVLRVVYRRTRESCLVVTFYPGKKSQYEKN